MSYVLSCIIVVISGLIGFTIANEYVKKYKFYKELCNFAAHLKLNISYNMGLLKESFISFKGEKFFENFLNSIIDLITNNQLNRETIEKVLEVKLDKEEKMELVAFFSRLGKSDTCSEQEFINGYKEVFKKRLNTSEELKNKNYNTYSKLGIGVGLIIAIIVI